MNNSGQIEIPFDKGKLKAIMLAANAFVLIGIVFVIIAPSLPHIDSGMRIFIAATGIVTILFFGFGVRTFSKKINDNIPALIINDVGFTDNSSGVSAGFVPWSDVIELRERAVISQTFLMVIVKNPEQYLDKQSGFKKFMMSMNYKTYGSPISISSNNMKMDFYEMRKMFEERFANSKATI